MGRQDAHPNPLGGRTLLPSLLNGVHIGDGIADIKHRDVNFAVAKLIRHLKKARGVRLARGIMHGNEQRLR